MFYIRMRQLLFPTVTIRWDKNQNEVGSTCHWSFATKNSSKPYQNGIRNNDWCYVIVRWKSCLHPPNIIQPINFKWKFIIFRFFRNPIEIFDSHFSDNLNTGSTISLNSRELVFIVLVTIDAPLTRCKQTIFTAN